MPPPSAVSVIFTVRTPPDWFTIPLLNPVSRRRSVAALVRTRIGSRDDQPLLRARVEAMIDGAIARTEARNATHLCVWTAKIGPTPAAASLVTSVATGLDLVGSPAGVALMVADRLASGGSVAEIVELVAGPAVRRQRTVLGGGTPGPEPGGDPVLGMTMLEYFVPVPDPAARAVVALTFATPVASLAGPLVELFDAIAASLRWEGR